MRVVFVPAAAGIIKIQYPLKPRDVAATVMGPVIIYCWRHTMQLESDTCGARPRISCSSITFDFPSSATFTSSHHCDEHQQQIAKDPPQQEPYPSTSCDDYAHRRKHSLCRELDIVLISLYHVLSQNLNNILFLLSPSPRFGGAKEKVCI